MILYLSCCWLVSFYFYSESLGSNEFDTYNADECQRIRRPWLSLTTEEQQDYVDALLQIRENGEMSMDKDELIAVASVHQDDFGSIVHTASSYMFWHGYLLWEIESRIRNLGGKYKCFAVPYWDFSTEADRKKGDSTPDIFKGVLGGLGNPDDYFTVNGYSWDYTTKQYWVPAHCDAEGDEYPICSLKRSTSGSRDMSADITGEGIMDHPIFADFSRWYASTFNLPHNLLTDQEYLHEPVVTSYDPIWYLFHSMVSYHQAIWTDCNEYDQIDPKDLDSHSEAYSEFCDSDLCGLMGLDDQMFFGGLLQEKSWAFVHSEKLTIRKSYHLDRWNVKYDLGDGSGFFTRSGLREYCHGKLNKNWWILNENTDENEEKNMNIDIMEGESTNITTSYNQILIFVSVIITIGFLLWCSFRNKSSKINIITQNAGYGSV